MKDFRRELMGNFEVSERERLLRELAGEYHRRCEEYDQLVCSGRRDGIAVPGDGRESRLINVNARKIMDEILSPHPDLSRDELRKAIQDHA